MPATEFMNGLPPLAQIGFGVAFLLSIMIFGRRKFLQEFLRPEPSTKDVVIAQASIADMSWGPELVKHVVVLAREAALVSADIKAIRALMDGYIDERRERDESEDRRREIEEAVQAALKNRKRAPSPRRQTKS